MTPTQFDYVRLLVEEWADDNEYSLIGLPDVISEDYEDDEVDVLLHVLVTLPSGQKATLVLAYDGETVHET